MDDSLEAPKENKTSILPLKTTNEIISKALDGKVRCSKSFVKVMQMCGTAFISQLAVELSLQAEKTKSKMIGDELVFQSLDALGFKELTESVKQRLADPNFAVQKKGRRKRMLEVVEAPSQTSKRMKDQE